MVNTRGLSNKVAIVTGASKGIGSGIATALAGAGARVAVNYSSDRKGAERVVQAIVDSGGQAIAVGADVSKPADVARLFKEVDAAFERPLYERPAGCFIERPGMPVGRSVRHGAKAKARHREPGGAKSCVVHDQESLIVPQGSAGFP